MSKKQITEQKVEVIGSAVADLMGACMIPGGNTLSTAIQQVFKKRLDAAREILLEEISNGNKGMSDTVELDEIAAIIYRYGRAAQEGAARNNLRLLAQVIAGNNSSKAPTANEFLYYADILSSLNEKEIKLLGIMVREKAKNAYTASSELEKHFSEEEREEILQSLLRTGLVVFYQDISVEDETDWKMHQKYNSSINTEYYLTSLMEDICKHVSFDKISEKEYHNNKEVA